MYKILTILLLGFSFILQASNLLENSSFETSLPYKKSKWRVELFKEWECKLNSSQNFCDVIINKEAFDGKQALNVKTLGKSGFTSVVSRKLFPVNAGSVVTTSVMLKGKGIGYIRVYFYDENNKRLKNYEIYGLRASDKYAKLFYRFTVPVGVAKVQFALETLRDNADIIFDNAFMSIAAGDALENAQYRVLFNPRLGASIASFFWKEKNFEFTCNKTLVSAGNMANCVIPANRVPGVFYKNNFVRKSSTNNSITYFGKVDNGDWAGLEMTKTFTLTNKGINVKATLTNKSKKKMNLTWRTQNFISSQPGVWSWPTPDWVTIFAQTGAPLNGLNQVVHDIFRAKWQAKYYDKLKAAIVVEVGKSDIKTIYSYFNPDPQHSTAEFYHRDFALDVNQSRTVDYSIYVAKGDMKFYADEHGKKQKFEKIEPIKLPKAPEMQASLPENYFPYVGGNGNLNQYEMAGFHKSDSYAKTFSVITPRLFKRQIDAYLNSFASGRLIYGPMHQYFWRKDGKHILGEMIERFQLKYFLSTLFVYRHDVDVDKYMKESWPAKKAIMTHPDLVKFIKMYNKNIPLIYTADELLPQNIDVLLRVNEELAKLLPEHILPVPYLNSSATDFIDYVPAFIGDWYPIKRTYASDRNPWNVYNEFTKVVKKAKNTPVWFMPQGFAAYDGWNQRQIYALPTAGETRLMLHLAIAAGVKGIAWHGFPSGTWIWMMNYRQYRYSFLGGAGQTTPPWEGVIDGGRAVAAVGPILTKSKPVALAKNVVVNCKNFVSKNKFYEGPAVKAYQLKTPNGKLYMVVNQNPYDVEKCIVSLPEKNAFDMINLKNVNPKNLALTLKAGDAAYIYCGNNLNELEPSFKSRFRAERARYLLKADIANGFGIKVANPDKIAGKNSLEKTRNLIALYQKLEKDMTVGKAGAAIKTLEEIKNMVNDIDFKLTCAWELAVPEKLYKSTKRYARYGKHPDAKFQAMKERLVSAFADYFAMTDAVENGAGFKAVEKIDSLKQRVASAAKDIENWIKNHPDKHLIDDPFEGMVSK